MNDKKIDGILYELGQLNENSQALYSKIQTMTSALEFAAYNLSRIAGAMEKKK